MLRLLVVCAVLLGAAACGTVKVGRPFAANPRADLKIGHDRKADVVRKMGEPYRRFVDSAGHEVFTYVYADGGGGGSKALIAFNKNDVVYLVEVVP